MEYPVEAAGQVVACPHCKLKTRLGHGEAGATPGVHAAPVRPSGSAPILVVALGLIALSMGGWYLWKVQNVKESTTPARTNETVKPVRPKSLDDLKVSDIVVEKAKGSNLAYAVGQVHNDSAHTRYGVKISLKLLNAAGQGIGQATDYTQSILPHQLWGFRVLVVEPRAVSVAFQQLQED